MKKKKIKPDFQHSTANMKKKDKPLPDGGGWLSQGSNQGYYGRIEKEASFSKTKSRWEK